MKLHEEQLRALTELGDVDGVANAQWSIAEILLDQGDLAGAAERLGESWAILLRIGRVDAIAVVGTTYAQVLAATGCHSEAAEVIGKARKVAARLGAPGLVQHIDQIDAAIRGSRP